MEYLGRPAHVDEWFRKIDYIVKRVKEGAIPVSEVFCPQWLLDEEAPGKEFKIS